MRLKVHTLTVLSWPARSPDLTPLYFYLSGKLKPEVYQKVPTTTEDMKDRIRRAQDRRQALMKFKVQNRITACMSSQGHHFEHMMN